MLKNVAGQSVTFSLFKSGARIADPTMAAGDFKVDLDGAGQGNVATLPTSDAAGLVTWAPSQAETNADVVTFLANDAAGDEWEPLTIAFVTDTATVGDVDTAVAALNDLSAADVNAEVVDVLRTDTLPDSYAADGAQPTFAQAVLSIQQFLQEREVSATTVTVNKPDGTTAAMTFTLDDALNPTSITRAS
jgi:hypothetical protein